MEMAEWALACGLTGFGRTGQEGVVLEGSKDWIDEEKEECWREEERMSDALCIILSHLIVISSLGDHVQYEIVSPLYVYELFCGSCTALWSLQAEASARESENPAYPCRAILSTLNYRRTVHMSAMSSLSF
jgi:hypothetical protein